MQQLKIFWKLSKMKIVITENFKYLETNKWAETHRTCLKNTWTKWFNSDLLLFSAAYSLSPPWCPSSQTAFSSHQKSTTSCIKEDTKPKFQTGLETGWFAFMHFLNFLFLQIASSFISLVISWNLFFTALTIL